jgi:hypothetical protein
MIGDHMAVTGEIIGSFEFGESIQKSEFEQYVANGLTILFPFSEPLCRR